MSDFYDDDEEYRDAVAYADFGVIEGLTLRQAKELNPHLDLFDRRVIAIWIMLSWILGLGIGCILTTFVRS